MVSPGAGYSFAVAATLVAGLARWLLDPVLGDQLPYVTFYLPVVAAAYLGGFRPALLAAVLGAVLAWWAFVPPHASFSIHRGPEAVGLLLHLGGNAAIAGLGGAMRTAQHRSRQAEALAHQQAEMLRTTLTSIGDAVIATDASGEVTLLNDAAQSLTGWTAAEASGMPLSRVLVLVNEHTRDPLESPARRVLTSGQRIGPTDYTILVDKNGAERPIDEQAAPIRDADGRVIGAVLIFRDVTERRRAEVNRLHLAAIVHSSDDAIVSKDLDGIVTSWNKAAERVFGYTESEMVGRPIATLIPVDRHDEEKRILERIRRGHRVETHETVRRRKDGTLVPVAITVSPLLNQNGQVVGASKIARDITEGKRAEHLLTEHKRLLELVAGGRPLDECLSSVCKAVATLSPGARACLLLADDNGRTLLRLVASGIPSSFAAGLADAPVAELLMGSNEQPVSSDEQAVHSGQYVTCSDIANNGRWSKAWRDHCVSHGVLACHAAPVFGLEGLTRAVFMLCFDEARLPTRWELRLADFGSQVASIALERDHSQEELRRSAAALTEAHRRKDEFLAILAHELRNPLGPIRNAVQVLNSKAMSDPELAWSRDLVDRQVQVMGRVLDDLLDVARISRGQLQIRKQRLVLGEVLESAIQTSRPLIESEGHHLAVSLPSTPIHLDADPVRLAQVFSNLLNNAAKYTDRGGSIQLVADTRGTEVIVSVRDNGIGIEAGMLPRLFDMFSQAAPALERSQGGLGVGLSLARRLLALHGGTIEAHSEGPGRGSEFVVRLPVAHAPAGLDVPLDDGSASADAPRRRVLVVDDSNDGADSLALMLRRMGHEASSAYGGEAGLVAARTLRPEIILLDIGMPGLNGYEVCRRIREEPWGKDVVVIALTGWGREQDRRQSAAAGFTHHLVKPIDPAALLKLLASPLSTTPSAS